MAELSKFDELRIKTGKQLGQLINHELDLGIRDARQALKSADTWAAAEASYLRAKRAYAEVSLLIPLVAEITEDERSRAETGLEHLHGMLKALSAIPAPNGLGIETTFYSLLFRLNRASFHFLHHAFVVRQHHGTKLGDLFGA